MGYAVCESHKTNHRLSSKTELLLELHTISHVNALGLFKVEIRCFCLERRGLKQTQTKQQQQPENKNRQTGNH